MLKAGVFFSSVYSPIILSKSQMKVLISLKFDIFSEDSMSLIHIILYNIIGFI
jgi:hypothetical protein